MLKPNPNAQDIVFKEKFVEQYRELTDWDVFKKYSLSFLRKSIRVNTIKSNEEHVRELMPDWEFTSIPWCKEGFWVAHKKGRLDIGNTIPHALGYYYVQEAASMIPPLVLQPDEGDIVLDMAAAPGSKTSQMVAMMNNTGIMVANDISHERLAALGINLTRCGSTSHVMTKMRGERISGSFDKVLLDAPCSGTGTIRKSLKTIAMWNPNMIGRLGGIQKRLLDTAYRLVKPGGTVVYSTCSSEPVENEGVIDYFLDRHPDAKLGDIDLNLKRSEAVTSFGGKEYNPEVHKCLRLWPQDNDTEGFFVTKITKPHS
ncbi:MAG: NOL1/NOP2/sun family putative RNA methylase [Candidatus Woesearchaeota archaeon]|nr:NOL1/NOP2/sun family putative RNA methylase [Candidatus Woesearchaeota archaeon]MDP7198110.1 NOL1/NOP2/sun family putative RNA methylase [Candidatus Woesearchaeota archaeon]MDP7466944.1 NOL1/NOP2/sun family putative RNA methylase [Candidatus Woesearchaeota archaeon]MDP7646971.1 NOL1/NOP2/sun family putative RNA methylase [Candidatus Woesearchaeota archaeon]